MIFLEIKSFKYYCSLILRYFYFLYILNNFSYYNLFYIFLINNILVEDIFFRMFLVIILYVLVFLNLFFVIRIENKFFFCKILMCGNCLLLIFFLFLY